MRGGGWGDEGNRGWGLFYHDEENQMIKKKSNELLTVCSINWEIPPKIKIIMSKKK